MNRRRFLSALAAGVAGLTLPSDNGLLSGGTDPERLLWTPGAKTHILPPAGGWRPDWSRIARQYRNGTLNLNHLQDGIYRDVLVAAAKTLAEDIDGSAMEYWYNGLLQERQRAAEDFRVRTRGTMAYRTPDGVVGLNDVLAPLNKHISAVQDALFEAAALRWPRPVFIPPDVS